MSNRRTNKSKFINTHHKIQQKNQHQQQCQHLNQKKQSNTNDDGLIRKNVSTTEVVNSVHKSWPDLQLNQSRLFFECTLFLYSVLALFLQYLNLYKTLWWLPKSYWPYSLKYHLINPYLLSCIGLLLGVRVTKCFWDVFSEKVDYFAGKEDGWQLTLWKIFEYAIVKTPLTTIVCTSFLFSFTRIYLEFGVKALTYFFTPLIFNLLLFHTTFIAELINTIKNVFPMAKDNQFTRLLSSIFAGPHALHDLDSVVHVCSDNAERTKEEARFLFADFKLRCRYCIYTGLLTAYFSIFMPRALTPMKTIIGKQQYMLIDDIWVVQLFAIVTLTACSLYMTFMFPINYFDLLYRCAVHLGHWEQFQPLQNATSQQHQTINGPHGHGQHHRHGKMAQNLPETIENYNPMNPLPYNDGTKVTFNNNFYIARSHPHFNTVCAEPANEEHRQFYRIGKEPVKSVTYLCIFQGSLVAFEFWLLLLTSDWQQIVTLVLLMFSNYLLLGKMFKDRVVIGRMYKPSSEDVQMIKQLQQDMEMKKTVAQQQNQQQQKTQQQRR